MTLKPLIVMVTTELEKEISEIAKKEKLDKATVIQNLLKVGIMEWRKQNAIELLQNGKVTFSKAADIAKLSLWEFADLLNQSNVEWVKFKPEDIEKKSNEKEWEDIFTHMDKKELKLSENEVQKEISAARKKR